jgi:type VI secretion system protein ImpE
MTAKELLDGGDLKGAIQLTAMAVKTDPSDWRQRTFLFELLCFTEDLDRAQLQLAVIALQSVQSEIGVQVYRNNLKAERERRRLFADGLQPHFLSEPPAYVDLLLQAINRVREENFAEARALLDRAEEERPALAGKLNDQPFADFRDFNDFIGPVLEVIFRDQYTWLPFEQVKRIEMSAPKQLRDMAWMPARVEARDGTIGEVFIPVPYAHTCEHPDDKIRLGRMTDWIKLADDLYVPVGPRLFLVDDYDRAMLEVKSIEFDSPGGV